MGPIADDAMWMNMTKIHKKKLRQRGRLAFSISIMPEDDCESRPAGHGRSEPNDNPKLPEPTGRPSVGFNPFAILNFLMTPEILCCICCCLCVFLILAVMLYGGSYYVTYETFIDSVRR